MQDPSNSPERRYNPRDEQIVFSEVNGKGHVRILHKPTGIVVEATGEDIDMDELRANLMAQVESQSEAVGRILDSAMGDSEE